MNIDKLLKAYFSENGNNIIIEVFDDENIYSVYSDVVKALELHANIELGVLQALSYCFYEILDNVLTHSKKTCGTTIICYDENSHCIKILVADDGIGIRASLSENKDYADISEADALSACIKDHVTDGKGMGFGLYSTSMLIDNAGVSFMIHSGNTAMQYINDNTLTTIVPNWQGTIVYFELKSDVDMQPNEILGNRVDAESEYNDQFMETDDNIDNLW